MVNGHLKLFQSLFGNADRGRRLLDLACCVSFIHKLITDMCAHGVVAAIVANFTTTKLIWSIDQFQNCTLDESRV